MSEALFRFASLFILLCHVCSSILGPSPFLKAAVTKNDVKFDPYVDNGGTAVGIAGKDYVIVATDTRLSDKYSIKSRKLSKVFEVCFQECIKAFFLCKWKYLGWPIVTCGIWMLGRFFCTLQRYIHDVFFS